MSTPDDFSAEITRLERLLNSGITSGNTDGRSAPFDLAEVRRRLAELKSAQSATGLGDGYYRPRNATIDLSGARWDASPTLPRFRPVPLRLLVRRDRAVQQAGADPGPQRDRRRDPETAGSGFADLGLPHAPPELLARPVDDRAAGWHVHSFVAMSQGGGGLGQATLRRRELAVMGGAGGSVARSSRSHGNARQHSAGDG